MHTRSKEGIYMSKRRKNNIIIGCLLGIVLLMAVGYAAFSNVLNISGTGSINSIWNIEITGIEKAQTKGNVTEIAEPTYTKDTATFSVGLEAPGDYIYYKVAVTNKGTLAAIATLGNLDCGNSNAISCGAYADSNVTNIGSNQDLTSQRLIIGPNETEYYNIWVKYNEDITQQPNVKSANINLQLTYEQSDVGITHNTPDNCYTGKVLEDGTLEITDYNEECGSDVVIPEEIDGYTVTKIADGKWDNGQGKVISAFANKNIDSVNIPDTIIEIGTMAFWGTGLENLVLGENVQYIDTESFYQNNLTSVIFPANVKTIGQNAFTNNKLSEINIPSSVTNLGGGAFSNNQVSGENSIIYNRNSDGTIDYSTLNSYAGNNTDNLEIPANVKTIAYSSFRAVNSSFLEVPSTVEKIDSGAFWGSIIKTIKLNEGLKSIEDRAFNTTIITSINIPNSVETIGDYAFYQSKLQTVTIGNGVESIGTNAFQYQNINGTIYNPITSITINKPQGSISGSPWGATTAQINWIG